MFVTRLALVLPLLLVSAVALAQTRDRPAKLSGPDKRPPEESEAVRTRVAEWLKTCLEDWDKSTHMTKSDWRTTCQRVAAERGRFLVEHPSLNVDPKARRR